MEPVDTEGDHSSDANTGLTLALFPPAGHQEREAGHEAAVRPLPPGQADPLPSLHHPRHRECLLFLPPPQIVCDRSAFLPLAGGQEA